MGNQPGAIWYQTFNRDGRKPSIDELVRLLMARPVLRRLLPDPIPANLPIYLLEAARWVPYRRGAVPIQAIIARDADLRQVLTQISGLGTTVRDAPVWLIIAAEPVRSSWTRYLRSWYDQGLCELASDVGMAVLMMILAAETANVFALPIWRFSQRTVHKTFGIPRKYRIFCLLALGYAETAPEDNSVIFPQPVTLFSHAELW